MPYLTPELREKLDPAIAELQGAIYNAIDWGNATSDGVVAQAGGMLNYIFNKLALGVLVYLPQNTKYAHLERLMGTFEAAKLEFWRRVVVPYEHQKMLENGDVFTDES